jgi:alpha/beta superfamily hydrolase
MIAEQPLSLRTADGAVLEALMTLPPTPRGAVVVCHPHPLYGGDMDNPVVVRAAEVCGEAGLATLRFNFRGAGRSTGVHGGGQAEQQDVLAALGHLASALGPGPPLALAGYSFGASVATAVVAAGAAPALAGLALIAPPLAMARPTPWSALKSFGGSLLVVAGDADHICPAPDLAEFARLVPSAVLETIPGADHFFGGKLYPLGQAVSAWARGL